MTGNICKTQDRDKSERQRVEKSIETYHYHHKGYS